MQVQSFINPLSYPSQNMFMPISPIQNCPQISKEGLPVGNQNADSFTPQQLLMADSVLPYMNSNFINPAQHFPLDQQVFPAVFPMFPPSMDASNLNPTPPPALSQESKPEAKNSDSYSSTQQRAFVQNVE